MREEDFPQSSITVSQRHQAAAASSINSFTNLLIAFLLFCGGRKHFKILIRSVCLTGERISHVKG